MDIPRITPRKVIERLDDGERIAFIDARSAQAYQDAVQQIPGSIRIPPDQTDAHVDDLPRGVTLVAYCT